MKYKVSDPSVTEYLKQIKSFVFTTGLESELGTSVLTTLLNNLQNHLSELKLKINDELNFYYKRLGLVTIFLSDLENKAKYSDNIDKRYAFYKTSSNQVTIFSGFMTIANQGIDISITNQLEDIREFKREKSQLNMLVSDLEDQVTLLNELSSQLSTLITKCST